MSSLKKDLLREVMRDWAADENDTATVGIVADMIDKAVMDIEISMQIEYEKIALAAVRSALNEAINQWQPTELQTRTNTPKP